MEDSPIKFGNLYVSVNLPVPLWTLQLNISIFRAPVNTEHAF